MAGDERELIDALRGGDETAFATLVAMHQPGFVRAARVWVKDTDAAREVVQATWLAALESFERFDGSRTPHLAVRELDQRRAVACARSAADRAVASS